jgi:hypothetical protein
MQSAKINFIFIIQGYFYINRGWGGFWLVIGEW